MSPIENTNSREEARRALAESRSAAARADRIVERGRELTSGLVQRGRNNHFAEKIGLIFRGNQ